VKILVINAGSSSLKYQLMDPDSGEVFAKGLCERIGVDGRLSHKVPAGERSYVFEIPMADHTQATRAVLAALLSEEHGVIRSVEEIDAVGHRVINAGRQFKKKAAITDEMIAAQRAHMFLGPIHASAQLSGIMASREVMPGIPMAASFDTGFHEDMPEYVQTYPLPLECCGDGMVRRYGYHSASHRYVSQRAAQLLDCPPEELRLITCHLGSGSSIAAIRGGKSLDTSMGFSAISGLPMGTRCGDMDPGVMEFLMTKYGMTIGEMMDILNKKSGLLGISGLSSDVRDLENAAAEGDHRAALALDILCYNVKKLIGAYAAAMGGVDAIIFTGGIGENAAASRMAMTSGLEYMGVRMDAEANNVRGREAVLSAADSAVKVLLIPTNEELMIARDTAEVIRGD